MLMITMHPSEDTGLTAGLKPSFNNRVPPYTLVRTVRSDLKI